MKNNDLVDYSDDPYGRILQKIDNIYQMNRSYLGSINLLLLVIVIIELSKLFR
jgi:hypothetical protein